MCSSRPCRLSRRLARLCHAVGEQQQGLAGVQLGIGLVDADRIDHAEQRAGPAELGRFAPRIDQQRRLVPGERDLQLRVAVRLAHRHQAHRAQISAARLSIQRPVQRGQHRRR